MSKTVVRADEDDKSVKAKEIEDALKADKARKDAEQDDKFQKLCDAVEDMTAGMSTMMDRMDAFEKKSRKDGDLEDVEDIGKPKPSFDETDPADPHMMIDAQVKADAAMNMLGMSAPKPLAGEGLLAYRKRLLRPLQKYSPAFKDSDLGVASVDDATFNAVEASIYADAITAAKNPEVGEGRLMERTTQRGGHTFTEFYGDSRVWLNTAGHNHVGSAVSGFGPTTTK
jgi:hypothetical protein